MPEGEEPPAPVDGEAPAADGAGVAEPVPIEPIGPETLAAHLKIAASFRVFDHENNNTVDVRYVCFCPKESTRTPAPPRTCIIWRDG